jgi:protein-disulfide isomerase
MDENKVRIEKDKNNPNAIAAAILVVGVIIAGAILLKDSKPPVVNVPVANPPAAANPNPAPAITLSPINASDRVLGNPQAKVSLVMYEDFQCPFCEKIFKESEGNIRDTYVKDGSVQFVYRDYAFLGTFVQPYVEANDESIKAAQAARCAGDQGKFWEYHDYLYNHQNGENKGGFAIAHLKEFANTLGLDTASFNQCLTSKKYAQAVADSKTEGTAAGVNGTPKGFILKNGNVVDTIEGAQPFNLIKQQLDAALK